MMIKTLTVIGILLFIFFIGTAAYYINEGTKNWEDIDNFLVKETVVVDNVSIPKIKLDFSDRAPVLEFVSATEYTKGDGNGSTIVKLIDWRGDKINTTCYEKILFPDKSTYVDWTLMTQHWEYGNYYMNFVVPEPLGIYDQEVRCLVGSKNISIGKGFHVGNLTGVIEANTKKVDIMSVMS